MPGSPMMLLEINRPQGVKGQNHAIIRISAWHLKHA
jgi:uncharacterized HAD superfamily protein